MICFSTKTRMTSRETFFWLCPKWPEVSQVKASEKFLQTLFTSKENGKAKEFLCLLAGRNKQEIGRCHRLSSYERPVVLNF